MATGSKKPHGEPKGGVFVVGRTPKKLKGQRKKKAIPASDDAASRDRVVFKNMVEQS